MSAGTVKWRLTGKVAALFDGFSALSGPHWHLILDPGMLESRQRSRGWRFTASRTPDGI